MYGVMIRQSCIFGIVHHGIIVHHMSPQKVIIISLIIFPVLYFSCGDVFILDCNFSPSNSLHLFCPSPNPSFWATSFVLYIFYSVSVLFVDLFFRFHFLAKSYGIFVSLSDIFHSIMLSGFIHITTNGKVSFFSMAE